MLGYMIFVTIKIWLQIVIWLEKLYNLNEKNHFHQEFVKCMDRC